MTAMDGTAAAPPNRDTVQAPGLREAARLLLAHLGDHVELLRVELSDELSRLGAVLGCWFALALLVQLALAFAAAVAIASAWNTEYQWPAVAAAATVLLLACGYCVWQMRRLAARAARRFAHSGRQLRRDLDLIRELI